MVEIVNRAQGFAAGPKRVGNGLLLGITAAISIGVGLTIGLIPVIGPAISGAVSHVVDRFSNHVKARRELDARADWYRNQIAATLGIDPRKVKGKHLEQAAAMNPELAAAVRDVRREESKDNKLSVVANTAVAVIPGGTVAKEVVGAAKLLAGATHTAKILGATVAGGFLVDWTTKSHLSAQEVIEGISGQLEAARAQGMDPRSLTQVVTPQMVFLLRVAQDEALGKEISENFFKKPFNQLNAQEQATVMQAYAPLANAATSEAYAVINNMMPVQELMATKPNLNGTAQYKIGAQAVTFAGREVSQNLARGAAANDGGFTGRITNERAAAQSLDTRQA